MSARHFFETDAGFRFCILDDLCVHGHFRITLRGDGPGSLKSFPSRPPGPSTQSTLSLCRGRRHCCDWSIGLHRIGLAHIHRYPDLSRPTQMVNGEKHLIPGQLRAKFHDLFQWTSRTPLLQSISDLINVGCYHSFLLFLAGSEAALYAHRIPQQPRISPSFTEISPLSVTRNRALSKPR
jgi:hypothetical protein